MQFFTCHMCVIQRDCRISDVRVFNVVGPGAAHCPAPPTVSNLGPQFLSFSVSLAGGRVTDGHGEGEAGAGVHEGKAVLHSAVSGREGNASDQPPGREKEALGGSSGDEVSVFTMFSTRQQCWSSALSSSGRWLPRPT